MKNNKIKILKKIYIKKFFFCQVKLITLYGSSDHTDRNSSGRLSEQQVRPVLKASGAAAVREGR